MTNTIRLQIYLLHYLYINIINMSRDWRSRLAANGWVTWTRWSHRRILAGTPGTQLRKSQTQLSRTEPRPRSWPRPRSRSHRPRSTWRSADDRREAARSTIPGCRRRHGPPGGRTRCSRSHHWRPSWTRTWPRWTRTTRRTQRNPGIQHYIALKARNINIACNEDL